MQSRTSIRKGLIAASAAVLLSGTAMATSAATPSMTSSGGDATPSPDRNVAAQATASPRLTDGDLFCRRDAAARTGFISPEQAASHEQTAGTVGGTLGGAALGALVGGASCHPGTGAAIGAGAGLIAGTAIGADNARHAADAAEQRYAAAYYACLEETNSAPGARSAYAYDGPAVTLGFGYHGHHRW